MFKNPKWTALLCILLLHCRQHPKLPQTGKISNGNYYECVLIDPVESRMHCGEVSVAVAMKFKMREEDRELAIIFSCPEFYGRNFFLKGQAYKVRLTSDSSYCKGCLVIHEYQSTLPAYYAMSIDKIYSK